MIAPGEITDILGAALWDHPKLQLTREPVPNAANLAALVDQAYQATMLTEEARPTVFTLAYVKSDSPSLETRRTIRFTRPRSFSAQEIRRLAPAADSCRMILGVHAAGRRLAVWGLIDNSASRVQFSLGEEALSGSPPSCLLIVGSAPGSMAFSAGQFPLLRLLNGEVRRSQADVFTSGEVGAFFQTRIKDLSHEAFPNEAEDFRAPMLYFGLLRRLISEIEGRGHGGSVLLLRDEAKVAEMERRGWLKTKYSCRLEPLWPELVENLRRSRKWLSGLRVGIRAREFEIDSHNRILCGWVEMVGALGLVDGAMAFTDRFRLLGFGVEISNQLPDVSHFYAAGSPRDLRGFKHSAENHGTRHRSVFRFCNQCPDSIGVVISQDGGAKLVKKVKRRIMVWENPWDSQTVW